MEPTFLVVGIGVKNIIEDGCSEVPPKYDGIYEVSPFNHSLDDAREEDKLFWFGAGYEHKEKGSPDCILGVAIFSTWNSAVEIDDQKLEEIKDAKDFIQRLLFEHEIKENPKVFVIGHQR